MSLHGLKSTFIILIQRSNANNFRAINKINKEYWKRSQTGSDVNAMIASTEKPGESTKVRYKW